MHPIYMRTSLCEPKSHSTPSHDGSCRLDPKSLIPVSSSWSDGVASGEECGLTVFLDLVGVIKWLPFGRFPSMAVKIWANNCISSKASKKLYEKGMYLSVWYLFYFFSLIWASIWRILLVSIKRQCHCFSIPWFRWQDGWLSFKGLQAFVEITECCCLLLRSESYFQMWEEFSLLTSSPMMPGSGGVMHRSEMVMLQYVILYVS